MTVLTQRPKAGAHIISEANGTLSRERIVVNATAGILAAGTVLAALTAANAATATAAGGNTGNGTVSAITIANDAITGNYTIEITAAAANAGDFVVTDPFGTEVGTGTVGVAFTGGGVAFTLGDGSTDFEVGDAFTLAVNAGVGEYVAYDNDGTDDGRRAASAILYAEVDATTEDAPGVAHVRMCEVNGAELTGLDDDAVADLRQLGIIVR
jgi:hypothetical protein